MRARRRHYAPADFKLIKSEELRIPANRAAIVNGIFSWLGLPSLDFANGTLEREHNVRSTGRSTAAAAAPAAGGGAYERCLLEFRASGSYLSRCNEQLVALTGDDRWRWWEPIVERRVRSADPPSVGDATSVTSGPTGPAWSSQLSVEL